MLARWGERHATEGHVDGSELTNGFAGVDRLLLHEDRSRLATLYLWLSQRFPDVYASGAGRSRAYGSGSTTTFTTRSCARATAPKRDRAAPKPFRPKGPPKFQKRRLPK